MNEEKNRRFADYLDGLLDEHEAREVEAEIAADPGLLDDVVRLRELMYRRYAVPAPPDDLRRRIRSRFSRRPVWGVVRYAAVFAAGVLTTLVVQSSSPPTRTEASQVAPADPPPVIVNRRIR